MIRVTDTISINEQELQLNFIRAAGPGGQKVNKVETAVQLRFDAMHSPSLPDKVKARLPMAAGRRLTKEGIILITARRYRSQEKNRQDAIDRLIQIIRRAAQRPKTRRKSVPSRAAKARRLGEKRRLSEKKRGRKLDPTMFS